MADLEKKDAMEVKLDNRVFFVYIVAIILIWILNSLWLKVIDNFTYGTLGLNPGSTGHSALIALVATIIFLLLLFFSGKIGKDIQAKLTDKGLN